MEKLTVYLSEVATWRDNEYQDYASETVNGKRLRLRINMTGKYIVSHGEKVLYIGDSTTSAVKSFNLCEKP
ncbi:hypothetical protein LCGC14_1552410 [marine sediment metagenome]|uniref:Uncharacterized protein n=1 Tax=marine sediment metagenome TaxID=412755 RepID=A0A0F9IPV2_9ZZZZ|nr:hypothetical protein [Pricia sp.]